MRRIVALAVAIVLGLPFGVARADENLTVGDVLFQRAPLGGCPTLSNSKVSRGFGGGVCQLLVAGRGWEILPWFEFQLVIDGLAVDATYFRVTRMTPVALPHGIRVEFRYELVAPFGPVTDPVPKGALVLERSVTLSEASSVFEIDNTLVNPTAAAFRLSSARLDQVLAPNVGTLETAAYSGGSDWRDDFRRTSVVSTVVACQRDAIGREQICTPNIDNEGQVLRTDDGTGSGWFQVSERRGGVASRVGFEPSSPDWASTWAGVDYARDLLDAGPILTSAPDYNRVVNPAYPLPIRGRTIAPFSSFHVGRVATGVYSGGAQNAGVAYADYVAKYRQPAFARQVTLNSFHPWGHGANFKDSTMRAQTDVAASLGVDTIILDDQWQGGPGGESGDWNWDQSATDGDPARFPDADNNGTADIVEYVHGKGLKLGLWMSPAEFHPSSVAFAAHPEWSCVPIGTATSQYPSDAGFGAWDFTNADFRAYMTSNVDRLIAHDGVSYFKFDYQVWVDCPPHDYNDYEDAFAGWVDALQASHPSVTFEFDETNDQRMWAFESAARGPSWFDNYHGHKLPSGASVTKPAQLLHDVWMAAPWIPPSVIGAGTFDGTLPAYDPSFLLAAACLTHWTFWTDLTALSPAVRAEATWWIDWYHAHSAALAGGAYELTNSDPWDGKVPAAFQTGGYVFAFRQSGAAPVITLNGAPATFTLTNVRDGSILGPFNATDAIPVPISALNRAAVYQIAAV